MMTSHGEEKEEQAKVGDLWFDPSSEDMILLTGISRRLPGCGDSQFTVHRVHSAGTRDGFLMEWFIVQHCMFVARAWEEEEEGEG